ncbi:hypothetical protein CMQ_6822 [Grosmannia clavigera kw1407]|uniref:DnaJ homologue subfamily C member 28 conserved domain-containing protein n=1 Tax=Grosmannia clavigera (strain kw1407 / UAMH 11150) TaxID=655863 RepID=F0X7W4_GROCL|nr:uncharacterized protein CMQ_6822 [Grosmannia clavigera kw1407]EFX06501.1 hypothetical protein CMQ_6822 [Grosmannia clavigera kw1407]
MSRRLEDATEDIILTGGQAGRRALEDAGFSEELKSRLLVKIADAQMRSEHKHSTDRGLMGIAAATPWTGEEPAADTVLRMLDDSHRPLPTKIRGKVNVSGPSSDLRFGRLSTQSSRERIALVRDKVAAYAGLEGDADKGLSEREREAMRQEFRDRFTPDARAMPTNISGLAALANERIENAIARGQFRNIPRGPGINSDSCADKPFIDTTEYILNKMIQRQDIVPPWIEKQQELMRAAKMFRVRLRNDWRRHATRSITELGGSLQEQMARANAYALAEQANNPRLRDTEQISVPTNTTDDLVMVKFRELPLQKDGARKANEAETDVTIDEAQGFPSRDSQWVAIERSYMELKVKNLNVLIRSYNLMAPELARKPYFSLDRELRTCFADVAPSLADTIRDRAARPHDLALAAKKQDTPGRPFLDWFVGQGSTARVHESTSPNYGLKEMWRDLWKKR